MKKTLLLLSLIFILGSAYATTSIDVTITQEGSDPGSIILNKDFTVTATITSTESGTNAQATLVLPDGFTTSDELQKTKASISSGDTFTWSGVKALNDIDNEKIKVTFTATGMNGQTGHSSEIIVKNPPNIQLTQNKESYTGITNSSSLQDLSIQIKNTGETSAKNIVITLNIPTGFRTTQNETFIITELTQDEQKTITWGLIPNTPKYNNGNSHTLSVLINPSNGDENMATLSMSVDIWGCGDGHKANAEECSLDFTSESGYCDDGADNDEDGNTDSSDTDCQSDDNNNNDNDDGGDPPSGGGGGAPTVNGEEESISIASIASNNPVRLNFTKQENITVSNIGFSFKRNILNMILTVKALDNKPDTLTTPTKKVYKYLEISKLNFNNNDLNEAYIEFVVKKSWLNSNSINKNNVILSRYDGSWQDLETQILEEKSNEIVYKAITPGFSYFVINAIQTPEEEEIQQPQVTTTSINIPENDTDNQIPEDNTTIGITGSKEPENNQTTTTKPKESNTNSILLYFFLIGFIISVGVGLFLYRKTIFGIIKK